MIKTTTSMRNEHVMQRLFYVDALRAMAIVLLVMLHLPQYYPFERSMYAPVIDLFDMALFFAISGYVTNCQKFKIRKRLRLLIPFFVIGLVNTIAAGNSIASFFTTLDKNGYWFLWVMTLFCCCLFVISRSRVNLHIGFLIVELLFCSLFAILPQSLNYLFCVNLAMLYWPFLWLGIVLQRRLQQAVRFSPLLLAVVVVMGVAISSANLGGGKLLLRNLIAIPIVILLFVVFSKSQGRSVPAKVRGVVSLIGSNTLQIYVLHYFFLRIMWLPAINDFLSCFSGRLEEIVISPVLALVISFLCIGVSKMMYKLKMGFVFGR